MFLLAAMALALAAVALRTVSLPRWPASPGVLLAASLAVSGLGYVLLAPGLAAAVYVSGFLLLAFVTGTGITLRGRREVPQIAASAGFGTPAAMRLPFPKALDISPAAPAHLPQLIGRLISLATRPG